METKLSKFFKGYLIFRKQLSMFFLINLDVFLQKEPKPVPKIANFSQKETHSLDIQFCDHTLLSLFNPYFEAFLNLNK